MNPLLAAISNIIPLSEELQAELVKVIKCEEIRRDHFILVPGKIAKRVYFAEYGLVRAYYLHNGRELSSWFMREGDFIISIVSFFTQTPAEEYIKTVEDTKLWSISFDELQGIYKKFIEFNIIGRLLTERYYVLSELRTHQLRTYSAQDRYEYLLAQFPAIFQRVPLKHIASHLAMTPETLSRLRKQGSTIKKF